MLPVEKKQDWSEDWPDKLRFDFLVRTRDLSAEEAQRLYAQAHPLSAHRQAILEALVALTGRDLGPSPGAWRQALALEKRPVRLWRKPCEK